MIAGDMHMRGVLTHLDSPSGVGFGSSKIDVAHFGSRVADRSADCAVRQFAAMQ
jgi:hypothetical protein